MQADQFERLINQEGSHLASQVKMLREKAEHLIAEHVEALKERGEAFELSEDESRLLMAYRAFKSRSPSGAVFSWKTPEENGIVLPISPSLIVDPREVVNP